MTLPTTALLSSLIPSSPPPAPWSQGCPSTFPKGLRGVLRMSALVRGVNLLASSTGSSCQWLLEATSPSGTGLCGVEWWWLQYRNTTLRGLLHPLLLHPITPEAPCYHPYRLQGHKDGASPCHECHGFVTVKEGFDDDDLETGGVSWQLGETPTLPSRPLTSSPSSTKAWKVENRAP